jgi:cation diffusion facilitator family transporter
VNRSPKTADQGATNTTILFALAAIAAIAAAKGIAAWMTGSTSMVAEAVNSVADCGNQGLLLLGLKRSTRPPDSEFPLGHGRAIYFWSFIVALMLFSMGGMFSIYEGIHKYQHPVAVEQAGIAIGVLIFAIIAESVSMWGCMREVNKERAGRSLYKWFRQSRSSALIVIFGEDIAALLGLIFALIAISVSVLTGNPLWDAIGTMTIGALLIIVAIFIAIEIKELLIGQSMDPEKLDALRQFLSGRPEIAEIYNLITMQFGPDIMVAVKARLHTTGSERAMIEAINGIEAQVRTEFPAVTWLFFEPDHTD